VESEDKAPGAKVRKTQQLLVMKPKGQVCLSIKTVFVWINPSKKTWWRVFMKMYDF